MAAAVAVPAPHAEMPSGAPALVARARPLAVVAHADRCTLCGACLDVCTRGAIALRETAEVDATLCNGCGACVDACPSDVLRVGEA